MEQAPNALTKGSVVKALVTFTLPFLLANVLQSLYGAVDLFVVGQYCDAQSVAAVSTGTQVTQIVTSLVTGLTLGGTILIGKYTGMERWDKVKTAIGTTLSIFALVALALTALMLLFTTGAIFFAVGVQVWKFAVVFIGGLVSMPIAWAFLHDYQRNRVLTFLDPERDPLGAGYHIIQSKIALGSGGVFGKGFLKGTQSHLNFLPEKHTDFIFTMLSEEFGMMGAVLIVVLNFLILAYSYSFALKSTSYFGKLVAIGLATNYFMYVFINISMVLGLIPVVGIPLPLISYGGTVMLSIMASFGIILSVHINRNVQIGKD